MSNSATDHTAVHQVVADAIRASVGQNRIETLRGGPHAAAICRVLADECEGSVED